MLNLIFSVRLLNLWELSRIWIFAMRLLNLWELSRIWILR
ncbi:hypothetical protein LEP1GSC074_2769 [Leptospira noguchii str. Hook]|nr:hypothetical protein LEP1GSC074_2769 [Leptospira noguchii str. Hook]